jgi:hypothetical protein
MNARLAAVQPLVAPEAHPGVDVLLEALVEESSVEKSTEHCDRLPWACVENRPRG